MKTMTVTPPQKRALAITTIIALVLGAYFVRTFVMLFVVAAIVAYIFNPIYLWLLKRWGKPGRSAMVVLLLTFLSVIIPMAIVFFFTAVQINHTLADLSAKSGSIDLGALGTRLLDAINHFLASIHVSYRLTTAEISSWLNKFISTFGTKVLGIVTSTVGSILGLITTLIIYIYVFLSMLKNQTTVITTLKLLNPLGLEIGDLYLRRIGAMTKAMVRGQFIIAVAQGVSEAALLYIAGLHGLFFFFTLLLTVFSIIPLGGGVIALPIGVVMLCTGNIAGGLIVILGHLLIITNIDNVLRPRLVPEEARLDSALTMVGVFAGLAAFGFPGIVVGPVIMIVIVTTIQVYLEVYTSRKMINDTTSAGGAKKSRLLRARQKIIKPLDNKA